MDHAQALVPEFDYMLRLSIADIDITVTWPHFMPAGSPSKAYADFVQSAPYKKSPLSVNVQVDRNVTITRPEKALFASEDAWSLYRVGKQLLFTWGSDTVNKQVQWGAYIDQSYTSATLFYDPEGVASAGRVFNVCSMVQYPFDQVLLTHLLNINNGAILHSAGGIFNAKGIVFPGVSGAGKTTLTNLVKSSPDSLFVTDDRTIIRYVDDKWFGYGSPWPGDAGIALNKKFQLDALVFLKHADETEILRLKPAETVQRLLQVASIPLYDKDSVNRTLDLFDNLISKIPQYELRFKPDESAVQAVKEIASSL